MCATYVCSYLTMVDALLTSEPFVLWEADRMVQVGPVA